MAISPAGETHPNVSSRQWFKAALVALLTAVLMSVLLTVSLVPRQYQLRVGDVSPADVRSPRRVTYISQVETKQARDRAAAAVAPQLVMDYDLVLQQRHQLNTLLQQLTDLRRQTGLAASERQRRMASLTEPPLPDSIVLQMLALDQGRWAAVAAESQRLLQDVLKERISPERLEEFRRSLPIRVSDGFSEAERAIAVELAQRFVQPNVRLDEEATERLRREAQDAVAPVEQTVESGEIVVRAGQVITPVDLEKLTVLGLSDPTPDWSSLGAAALLSFVTVGVISAYIYCLKPALIARERRLAMIGLLMVGTVVAAKIILGSRPMWAYIFPLPAVAMLVSALLSARLAVALSAFLAMLVGYIASSSLEVAVMLLAGSAVGAAGVWRREHLSAFFWTGLLVGLTQAAVAAAFYLASRADDVSFLALVGTEAILNGLLSAVLAVGMTYITGRLFGITTTLQLLELANPTHPLLRRLLLEAPGTYHHSILVGNLAERAAEEVGADPLLVRVAAYYHDVGKLQRPYCFIENQVQGANIHDTLEPRQSAEIIAAHVTDGLEIASKYGIPARVRELILQHHGTRLVSFFYQKDAENSREPVDRATFTYPGPKPQSKEGAILMLADGVEAAARATQDHSPEVLERIVDQIIMQRLAEGQLDECDLTLRDLTRIKQVFCTLLNAMYHPRIEYPQRALKSPHATS